MSRGCLSVSANRNSAGAASQPARLHGVLHRIGHPDRILCPGGRRGKKYSIATQLHGSGRFGGGPDAGGIQNDRLCPASINARQSSRLSQLRSPSTSRPERIIGASSGSYCRHARLVSSSSPTTMATSRPACRSRQPIEVPIRPPPMTTTSAVEEIRAELTRSFLFELLAQGLVARSPGEDRA